MGVYIWSIVVEARFTVHKPPTIDWNDDQYATAFLPYFFVQTTGPLSQSYMFWLLSSFATDAQGRLSHICLALFGVNLLIETYCSKHSQRRLIPLH